MVLVGGWRLADGDPPDEYLFTRDGASVECWSTPITEVHTFESYLDDRRAEARREPDEITVDGRSGWLFEFGATAFEAFWQESGHTMALRTYDLAGDEFREVLAAARHVSESEWQAAFDADRAAVDPPP